MKLMEIYKSMLSEGNNYKGKMLLMKNTQKAPKMGSSYGQDVEPAGFYCTQFKPDLQKSIIKLDNYKIFEYTIRNPLVIDVDDNNLIEWKRDLAKLYKAKGKALTNKLKTKGYDAIVTVDGNDTGEIIIFEPDKLTELDKSDYV